ncbi:MAG: enoyl-CoA hydratase/isomerase family protein [Desulfobacteraceae bacterium]|nr:MAG: enoyl-CoA hydratase/isomerase family protein [Desulfobacteraceae bacterium]
MEYRTILVEKKDYIGTLYLNRPEVLNAFSDEMREELLHFLQEAEKDDQLRVLIVSGKGKAFCAGGDLKLFKKRYEDYRREGQREGAIRSLLSKVLARFPKPMIAAVNGTAVGFGATLPLNCDIRIASRKARFSFAFARLGVTPELGSSYLLPRLIGFGQAAELVFTAKMFDAEEALRIGLISRVVQPEDLLPEAEKMADEIARLPPAAIMAAKRLLRHGSHSTLDQALDYEAAVLQHSFQTPEHYDAVCRMLKELELKRRAS